MSTPFSDETVQALAAQIDAQISALSAVRGVSVQRSLESFKTLDAETTAIEFSAAPPLAEQAAEIERITQEKPMRFLRKFRRAAKADICEEGGVLNAQWQKWKDLASGDVVKSFGPVLVAMGFSGVLLQSLLVAVAVVVIHIGLKAFCEEFGEDGTADTNADTTGGPNS
jgi:hypothetical protein